MNYFKYFFYIYWNSCRGVLGSYICEFSGKVINIKFVGNFWYKWGRYFFFSKMFLIEIF